MIFNYLKKLFSPSRNCQNHFFRAAINQCSICEKLLCEHCCKLDNKLPFCKEHHQLFQHNTWIKVRSAITHAEDSSQGIRIYNKREALWKKEKVPSFLKIDYILNEEKDLIESHITLFCLEGDVEKFKN